MMENGENVLHGTWKAYLNGTIRQECLKNERKQAKVKRSLLKYIFNSVKVKIKPWPLKFV